MVEQIQLLISTQMMTTTHGDNKPFALYRKVLRFKRAPTEESCLSSLGVLSYLKAFVNVITDKCTDETVLNEIEHLRLDDVNIEKSIHISLAKIKAKNARINHFWNNLRTITISKFGLLLSIIGLATFLKPKIEIDSQYTLIANITQFTVTQPLEAGGIAVVTGFFILAISGDIPWKDWNWVNDLARLANTFPKKTGAMILIIISSLFMWLALSFLK